MRRILASLTAITFVLGSAGMAPAEHLVGTRVLGERLAVAEAQRNLDVRTVRHVLSSPRAAQVAVALGTRIDAVSDGVPSLSDRELRDLAQRASVLGTDPVSGHIDADVNDFLVIFLVVAIVVVVIAAVK
jgi:hypothetical protein